MIGSDCANWSDREVPTSATNVTIDENYSNPCQVYTADGICNSISITSNSPGTIQGIAVLLGRTLSVQNDMNISKMDGSDNIIMNLQNGVVNVGGDLNLTLSSGLTSEINVFMSGSSSNLISASNISLINTSAAATSQISVDMLFNGGTIESGDFVLNGNGQANSTIINMNFSLAPNTLDVDGSIFLQNGGALNHSFGEFELAQNFFDTNIVSGYSTTNGNCTFDGAGSQVISTNDLLSIYNLILDKTGGEALLQGNVEITNSLNLSDDYINLNDNELLISNNLNTAISRTTGAVVSESLTFGGELTWDIGTNNTIHEFPFADGVGGTYVPFMFQLTSGSVDRVTLSTYGTGSDNLPYPPGVSSVDNLVAPGDATSVADRWWYITPQNDVGLSADITFTWANSESPAGSGIPNAQRFNESSSLWDPPVDLTPIFGTNPGSEFVAVQGITSFSPWGVARPSAPLPVELISFEVKKDSESSVLEWLTATEINSDRFVIERADFSYDFKPIGEVFAAGNSESIVNYLFRDNAPHSGINYYRLKQLDFDGTYEYSEIKSMFRLKMKST